jgi:hypothetical protein
VLHSREQGELSMLDDFKADGDGGVAVGDAAETAAPPEGVDSKNTQGAGNESAPKTEDAPSISEKEFARIKQELIRSQKREAELKAKLGTPQDAAKPKPQTVADRKSVV